jgi:hypothetical protein
MQNTPLQLSWHLGKIYALISPHPYFVIFVISGKYEPIAARNAAKNGTAIDIDGI